MELRNNTSTPIWHSSPSELELPSTQVHIWRGIVDISSLHLQPYWEILSPDEKQRAKRFKVRLHQYRFTVTRGILRNILASYLSIPPQQITFGLGSYGKPFIQRPLGHNLRFNITHSQGLALYALSRDYEVGIDIERSRSNLNYQPIAERILNVSEKNQLYALPASQQQKAFLTCWTRKEAFVKACGKGLAFPLRDLSVTFSPNQTPRILTVKGGPPGSKQWSLYNLSLSSQYLAALVVAGKPSTLFYWNHPRLSL